MKQAFPGLSGAPGGAAFAVADNLFDLTGPANEMTVEVLQRHCFDIEAQTRAIDPSWHYDEIGAADAFGKPIVTVQSLSAKLNDLRWQRAAVIARVQGDYGPLQVETLRFVQQRAHQAYEQGEALLKAGRLTPRLSNQEVLGNYIDQDVRRELRRRYNQLSIDSSGTGPVRVNRRENDTSGTEVTFRRPDARVSDVAFDVTIARKTLGTPQIKGFFNTDFRPGRVVIVRPRQLGADHTYILTRPGAKK